MLLWALQAIAAIRQEEVRALRLQAMVAQLRGDGALLQGALEVAAGIQDRVWCVAALSAEAAVATQGASDRAMILSAVAEHLSADTALLQRSLEAALIQDGSDRVRTMRTVADPLQGPAQRSLAQQALDVGALIPQGWDRVRALCQLATPLQGEDRCTIAEGALEAAATIEDEWLRSHALHTMAPLLQADTALLQKAFELAVVMADEGARSNALSAVAPLLQADRALSQKAFELIVATAHEGLCSNALTALAPRLHDSDLLQRSLEAAAALKDPGERASTLSAVAQRLRGEARRAALEQALQAVAEIPQNAPRSHPLKALSGQLPQYPQLSAVCLSQMLALPTDDTLRIELAVTHVRQDRSLLTYDLWSSLLRQARLNRPQLLGVIGELTGCAVALTGRPEAAEEIAGAIHDVCEWFP